MALGTVQVIGHQTLRAGARSGAQQLSRALPARYAVSMDVRLTKRGELQLSLGSPGPVLTLARGAGRQNRAARGRIKLSLDGAARLAAR